MTPRVRSVSQILAGGLLLVGLAACGGGSSSSSRGTATSPPAPDKTPTSTVTTSSAKPKNVGARCKPASAALVHAITIGLNGQGGKTLTHTYAVLSKGSYPSAPANLRRHVYFVAGSVLNRHGKPDVATWITGNLNGHALVYPANSLANHISTYHKIGGSSSKPRPLAWGIGQTSDGYEQANRCVEDARAAR
jgi:hypothetical protein